MMDTLEGCSLAEVLERLEKGRIGHGAAMRWLNVDSLDELVEILHVNGRLMPGHRRMRVAPDTVALGSVRISVCEACSVSPTFG
jgi:hypothetical protein